MPLNSLDFSQLAQHIKTWGKALGFQQVGITDTNLHVYEQRFNEWIEQGMHGEMHYLARNGELRREPSAMHPGTMRVISARMDYLPPDTECMRVLNNENLAYVSRYALGRDYHRLMRKRLARLAEKISEEIIDHQFRVFSDSAPVLEKPLAEKSGLGWIGKHTNVINAKAGSWFFLGEIYTNLPLPIDSPIDGSHCGSCKACITVCPTQAIIAPYKLDARRCISYLTIELRGAIPLEFRSLIGNRIYGCDDCQLCCPWNKFAKFTEEKDFHPRHQLENATLLSLFAWDEETFLEKTAGSAIRRIGHDMWLRNIAVALGNAPYAAEIIIALKARLLQTSPLVQEHIEWALQEQLKKTPQN